MTTIVTRAGKGSPLTNNEVDANFVNLNNAKIETLTSTDSSVTITGTGDSRNLSVPTNPNSVSGPASATDNAIARFDLTTGKLIQNSTITVDDNGNVANVNAITLDTTPGTLPTAAGTSYWDDGNGTEALILKGGNVSLQVGQEMVARVYNDSGVALTDGQIVYISGAQGNRIAVKLAIATADGTSAGTLGMVTESIAIGAEGFITVMGTVNGLNTIGLTQGALVYLSPTVAGEYTTTKPVAPQHTVTLGYIERVHATVGSIYVKVDNGYELDELHNVLISGAASGNTLIYDAVVGVWKNANITAGTGVSVTGGAGSVTIANTGVTSVTASTGISVSDSTGGVTITNSAPDQTVALTAGTGISTTGTYPNFTITNSAPDQTVSIASGTGVSITGTYPSFTAAIGQAVATSSNVQFASLGVGTAASGTAGEIRATNNVTAYYSDERLKTKIGNIENALDKVKQIETMVYHANETAVALGYDASIIEVGVTAQSVQKVMPQTVAPAPIDDTYLTVRYERLVPLLIESIKELSAEVNALKAKIG